ncbi:putative acetyltransferase [Actinacidiphila reveromycinica]|uniref:Putative acetyltransferase n=1 Tax=Actinacidiphila reveromycinica TaxID=659352 RepID=A0A7U3UPC9_9ACTN|nr:GNAT family N-acetyltransferase [Streptomyces sp. SN-593]BBA96243.1 putative acetyltransferase [Streptomyces sp. SN-593]
MPYRTATPADEAALHALWAAAFPEADAAAVVALWGRDPGRHGRTLVAEDGGGRLVSALHHLPRPIRSATGAPQRVGCVGSVATRPDARGRGHVRRLLAAAVAAMTADGCAWSLLFTATPRVYEGAGWRSFAAPGWSGRPAGRTPHPGAAAVRPATAGDLPVLRALRTAYDAGRPLTTVRSADDWAHRVPVWYAPPTRILVATTGGAGSPATGFVVLRRPAPGAFEVVEIALAPGHEEAAAGALLSAAAVRARAAGTATATVRLPADPAVVAALPHLLADPAPSPTHHGMARPLLAPPAEVHATVTAPTAFHWPADAF